MANTAEVIHLNERRRPQMVSDDTQAEAVAGGYLKLYRSLQDASFSNRPEYMSAWVHILLLATHKPRKTMMGNSSVALQVGQFVGGRRALGERIGVTEKQMRSILEFFEKEGMISKESSRLGTIFTVCKYSVYNQKQGQDGPTGLGQEKGQGNTSNNGASSEAGANGKASKGPTERATTQEHNTTRDTNVSLGSTGVETVSKKPPVKKSDFDYPKEFEWIWANRPRREGSDPKRKAFQACNARIKQGATWRDLAEGMKRYHAYCQTKGSLNTEYVKQMAAFFGPDEHFKNDWKVSNETNQSAVTRTATAAERTAELATETRSSSGDWLGEEYDQFA